MKNFIDKNSTYIILVLLILIFINGCNNSSKLNKIDKNLIIITNSTYKKPDLEKVLKIEGLKAEKRMLQSTDRKLLDLNREKEIDVELSKLEK